MILVDLEGTKEIQSVVIVLSVLSVSAQVVQSAVVVMSAAHVHIVAVVLRDVAVKMISSLTWTMVSIVMKRAM